MADSNIQLNTDGTGKKIDTRTEATNGEHRQVFVIGDPSTNAGVAPVDATKGLAVDLTNTGANTTAIKTDSSATTQPVSGNIASGSADSGNPVKVGGVYNSTPPVLTTGQRGDLQLDSSGRVQTTTAPLLNTTDSVTSYGTSTEQSSLTSGSLNADLVPSTDVSLYRSFSLQVTGTWSGTLSFQASNDNSNWTTVVVALKSNGAQGNTITANDIVSGPLLHRYLRVRMTSYSSGTANGTLELYTHPGATTNVNASATLTASSVIIGKVTTDQTTHGTTDLVAADNTKIGGVAVDTNSGTKSAGTQRIVIATDQPALTNAQPSNITQVGGIAISSTNPIHGTVSDGTNEANVVANDTGYNGVATNNTTKTLTFTTSSSGAQQLLANTDVRGYSSVILVWTAIGSGLAAAGQFSPNSGGTYYSPVSWTNYLSSSASPGAIGIVANNPYGSPTVGDYFRINITALTSGTVSGYVILSTAPITNRPQFVGTGANANTGSVVPSGAIYQGLIAKTASPTAASTGNLVGALADVMGSQLVTTGGLVTTAIASGTAGNTVVKASAGRICNILITTTNTNPMQVFDNSTTNSGTVIACLPASPTVGTTYTFNMPAANGITVGGSATNPGVTISWI